MSKSAFAVRSGGTQRRLTDAQRSARQTKLNALADKNMAKLKELASGSAAGSVDSISAEGVRTIKGMVTRKGGHLYIADGRGQSLRLLVKSGTVLRADANHARERLATGWESGARNRALNEAVTRGLARILELLNTQKEVRAELSGYAEHNPVGVAEFRASRIVVP